MRNNNADAMRFAAALAVIVSHAYSLTGHTNSEPVRVVSHGQFTLGSLAVTVFFVLSGYLITGSYDRSGELGRFVAARALRLLPALVVAILLTTFVYGPLLTTLPLGAYLRNHATWRYLGAIGLWHMPYRLPGVLESVPRSAVVNASLWTLWYELLCYAAVAAGGAVGLLTRRTTAVVVVLLIVASLLRPANAYATLGLAFASGTLWYFLGNRLRVTRAAMLVAVLAIVASLVIGGAAAVVPVAGSYLVLAYTFCLRGPLTGWAERVGGDYSYGVYVYAYPVQQAIVWAVGPVAPWVDVALATPPILALAVLSWRLVERPALAHKPTRRIADLHTPGLAIRATQATHSL